MVYENGFDLEYMAYLKWFSSEVHVYENVHLKCMVYEIVVGCEMTSGDHCSSEIP